MTITEIKRAVDQGQSVKWANDLYDVVKSKYRSGIQEYLIVCSTNNHTIGLHGKKGTAYENHLNGQENEFYIKNDN